MKYLGRGGELAAEKSKCKLVYVIGLHAVQFGNNWMKKIPRTAIGRRPSPIWRHRNFLNSVISKLDKQDFFRQPTKLFLARCHRDFVLIG